MFRVRFQFLGLFTSGLRCWGLGLRGLGCHVWPSFYDCFVRSILLQGEFTPETFLLHLYKVIPKCQCFAGFHQVGVAFTIRAPNGSFST